MSKFFLQIYYLFQRNRIAGFVILISILSLLIVFASKMKFEEDITKMIPSNEKSDLVNKVIKNVKFSDKIIVNISLQEGDENDLVNYADSLTIALQNKCSEYIKNIQGKIEDDQILKTYDFVYNHLPFFLNQDDYKQIEKRINTDSISAIINNNYKALISPSGFISKQSIRRDPLGITFTGLNKMKELQAGNDFVLFNNYLVTKDKRNLLLFITPTLSSDETAENTIFIQKLDSVIEQSNIKHEGKVRAEYFGAVAVAVANATQIKRDIQITVTIAIAVLFLLLIYFYRRVQVPVILFLPAVFGGLLALTCLYFIKGKISGISLGIGAVLLGITVDYSLHILTHYKKNNSVQMLFKDIATPTVISSVTTAVAFLCLLFLKSEALRDLGIFASISVVGACFFALIIIPQLYRPSKSDVIERKTFIDKISEYNYDKSKLAIGLCAIVLLVSLFTFKKVHFESDISKMNFQTEKLYAAQTNLDSLTNLSSKSIYLVSYGENINNALATNNNLHKELQEKKNANSIISFSSLSNIVLSEAEQKNKIAQWNEFWTPAKKALVKEMLVEEGAKIGFKENTYTNFYSLLEQPFFTIQPEEYQNLNSLLIDEYISKKDGLVTITSMIKVHEEDVEKVVDEFSDKQHIVVIDRQHLKETFLGGLKHDFNWLVWLSLLAILIILFIFFKSIELTIITITPILLSWLSTLGIMGVFDIKFNIFNVIISTFIFGLGIDYSIFVTKGMLKEYTYGIKELSTYKAAIVLSAITTILGVGVLVFAKHPALQSISILSIIGIVSAVIVSFTIQPLLFKIFFINRQKKGRSPWRLYNLILSVIAFSYYAIGSLLLSVTGALLIPIIPVSKKIKMHWFHKVMSGFFASLVYMMANVKKKVINPNNESFKKPAIIIANHSSFLDTLSIGMLSPKFIFLVNDWVHKSPIFGKAVRMAGFYPVSEGLDNGVSHLEKKIKQGYSLVVFPEGTRSETAKIKRFHKGAFFLAEKFNLDILPVLIHGNSDTMPKNDFMLKDGHMVIKYLNRISPYDSKYGENYTERTKKISAFFKAEFLKLREELETENYFKDKLLYNYIYKGAAYNRVKKDFKLNKERYKFISEQISQTAYVGIFDSDYGQLGYLLSYWSEGRKIICYDGDHEKNEIASNAYASRKYQIMFSNNQEEFYKKEINVLIMLSNELSVGLTGDISDTVKQIIICDQNVSVDKLEGFNVVSSQNGISILRK